MLWKLMIFVLLFIFIILLIYVLLMMLPNGDEFFQPKSSQASYHRSHPTFTLRSLFPKQKSTNCKLALPNGFDNSTDLPLSNILQHLNLQKESRSEPRLRSARYFKDFECNDFDSSIIENIDSDGDQEYEETQSVVFLYPPGDANCCQVTREDLLLLAPRQLINDSIIDFYIKYICNDLVPRRDTYAFNSFFYGRLSQVPLSRKRNNFSPDDRRTQVQKNYERLKNWTKGVDLFTMNYILIPINEHCHWYLAIICNPGAGIISYREKYGKKEYFVKTRMQSKQGPFLVVLNSLMSPKEDYSTMRENLAEYLSLEYKAKKDENEGTFDRSNFRTIIPIDLPQQSNGIDCGLFLLHFAECFLKNPPKVLNSDVALFMEWFPDFELPDKRKEIKQVIMKLAPELRPIDFTCHKKRRNKKSM